MKATELMVGNIVEIDGKPQRIRSIKGRKVTCCRLNSPNQSYAKISDINPIPITEELFLKNGFDNKSLGKNWFSKMRVKYCHDLYVYYDKQHLPEHWRLIIRNEQVSDLSVSYITHLHQLQNVLNIMDIKFDFTV